MVHAFIVHTLGEATCRILHTSHFGLENMSGDAEVDQQQHGTMSTTTPGSTAASSSSGSPSQQPLASPDPRLLRKEQIALVARQVQSEYTFRKAVSDRPSYPITMPGISIEDMLFDSEIGTFRLAPGDPFNNELIAVWLGVANTGFTFVCDKHENRQQAEAVLKLLAKHLQEQAQALTQPENVLLKNDRVATIVHYLLPCGRLLFMNHTVIKQIERDMESQLKAK